MLFVIASTAAALAVGWLCGFAGQVILSWPGGLLVIVVSIEGYCAWILLAHLRLGPRPPTGPSRQTNPLWRKRLGAFRAAVLWGLDLGNGLTTQPTVSFQRVLPMLLLLSGEPAAAAASYAACAVVRAIPIVIGPSIPEPHYRLLRFGPTMERVGASLAVLAAVSAFVIGGLW